MADVVYGDDSVLLECEVKLTFSCGLVDMLLFQGPVVLYFECVWLAMVDGVGRWREMWARSLVTQSF